MSVPAAVAIFGDLSTQLTTGGGMRAFLPVLVWVALVWLIGGLDRLPGDPNVPTHLDKVAHLAMYGVLGFLSGRAWRSIGAGAWIAVALVVLGLALGAADEWRQLGLSGRTGSVTDWLADATGIVGGFVMAATNARQRRRT